MALQKALFSRFENWLSSAGIVLNQIGVSLRTHKIYTARSRLARHQTNPPPRISRKPRVIPDGFDRLRPTYRPAN